MVAAEPCEYTIDSMPAVHTSMNVNEGHFTLMVELLINTMTKAKLTHKIQTKVRLSLAPMREHIRYYCVVCINCLIAFKQGSIF
jgi:hypothetical protein